MRPNDHDSKNRAEHRKDRWACLRSADGTLERPKPIKTTREAFKAFFTRPAAHVILAVGTHSRWVNQLLEQLSHRRQPTAAQAHLDERLQE
ncbi:MAG TPA: hypothetical protein VNA24_31840 [Hyalangium sp.]|jgi:hypothetical protein|nr:hypothetical protein [Hyalangium sp.]